MQDHYEILQVHPRADQEAIRAAYERLRERYDPSQLEGAADELLELARKRRDDIERAYAILGDETRRVAYDAELRERERQSAPNAETREPSRRQYNTTDATLDYRPLPPARRQERPRDFDPQPTLPPQPAVRRSGRQASAPRPTWVVPAVLVGVITFGVMLASLLIAGEPTLNQNQNNAAGPAMLNTPGSVLATPTAAELISQYDGQVDQAKQAALNTPTNPNAWISYGNALYDSVQVVRERLPDSETYKERLPRWIEASKAYSEALKLQPDNAIVRADLGESLCYYGSGINDQSYIEQGLVEVRRAVRDAPQESRPLLSLGICLVQSQPPQTQAALEQWRKVLSAAPPDSGLAFQAQRLIDQYGR